jgi:hypothetical protein
VKKQKTYNLEGYGFWIEKLTNNVGTFVVASYSCIENKILTIKHSLKRKITTGSQNESIH